VLTFVFQCHPHACYFFSFRIHRLHCSFFFWRDLNALGLDFEIVSETDFGSSSGDRIVLNC
jgi:hypothetical protein